MPFIDVLSWLKMKKQSAMIYFHGFLIPELLQVGRIEILGWVLKVRGPAVPGCQRAAPLGGVGGDSGASELRESPP